MKPGVYDTVCKIRKYKNIYITASGIGTEEAYKIALEACKNSNSIEEAITQFIKNDTVDRRKLLNFLVTAPYYVSQYHSIKTSSVVFCTFEKSVPKVIAVQIDIVSKVGEPIVLEASISRQTKLEPEQSFVLLGHYDLIIKKTLDQYFINKTTEQGIEDMILLECKKDSDVGKPINILNIYNDRYKWFKNPVKCAF